MDNQEKEENYEVENPQIKELLRGVGRAIGEKMPEGWGFSLFMVDSTSLS